MRVGWLADDPGYIGGAELTQAEFRAAAPEDVEIVDCPPGGVVPGLDRYVAHNIVHYGPEDIDATLRRFLTWYHHDLSPFVDAEVRDLLDDSANHIFCAPEHMQRYGVEGACIPPAVDLARFKPPRQSRKRRKGTCSIAGWRNPGKGSVQLAEWAAENGPVDVYGSGNFVPHGKNLTVKGSLKPNAVAQTLWAYERLVFLPVEFEPFCRCVAEAWAAGCEVVTNRMVGARYWLEEKPEALETAAEDFWEAVL